MATAKEDARLGIAASALALFFLVCGCAGLDPRPVVIDGRLDLSHWDFETGGDVALLGTWQVCWNQLLEPGEACPSAWRTVPVRGLWFEDEVGSPFGGRGVATYRMRIDLPGSRGPLSLLAGGPLTAHRLFIDGIERGRLGRVGETAETTEAEVQNRVYELKPGPRELDLLVQVANFEFRGGGLRRIWFVGEADSIQRGIGRAILREGTLFAVGVVVGLGFLTLFALRPSERARGYFGLIALVVGLRAVPASISNFGELIAPWMTWGFTVRAEYLGMAVAYFAAVGYSRTKVAGITPPRTMDLLQLVAIALAAIVAFAPMPVVLATLPLQYVLPMVLIGLVIVCYGRAWKRGVPGAAITTITAILYVGFVAHDILRTIRIGTGAPVELFPYAVVLWIFAEAFQLLREFHASLAQVETLSDELSEANFELQETEAEIVRFIPFDFLRLLGKKSIREVEPGDHARTKMSVLQCGFHTARMDEGDSFPARLDREFERINERISRYEPVIHHNNGFLHDYSHDGFQAFFPGGPIDAVRAAFGILAAEHDVEPDPGSSGGAAVEVGIGIDTGWVQLGTIGSGQHLVRGVVGEAVERARRVEEASMGTQTRVVISDSTRAGLVEDTRFEVRAVVDFEIRVGGVAIELYEVIER
jgi:hypothetical protein